MDQTPMAPPVAATGRPGPESDTSKLLAALGYPIWIVALIAILIEPYKNEKFVKFHAVQALALGIAEWVVIIAAQFLAVIPVIGWIVALVAWLIPLAVFVYQIILAIGAFNGNYSEVPILYPYIKSYIGE
jgi:uncharacterized membrane protein